MKYYAWIFVLAGFLAMPSCSGDSPTENIPTGTEKPEEKEESISSITAVLPTIQSLNRTEMGQGVPGESNVDFFWSKGDQICLLRDKRYMLNIDPAYDESQNGGQKTAKFTSNVEISPNVYMALYPIDVKVSGDTLVFDNFLDEIDFTSAKTPEDKAKIWKSHIDKHMILHAEQRLEEGKTDIKLQPVTSIASLTYTNLSGEELKINSIQGFPLNYKVWMNRRNFTTLYGGASEWKPLITKGLTLAPGESMYFYFHIHPWSPELIGSITTEYEDGWQKNWVMINEVANEVYVPTQGKGAEYTHVDLIETKRGIYWNVPDSGIPVTFENKGLSMVLWDMLGETMVCLNDEGHAIMDDRDVRALNEINMYLDNPSDITSLAGIEKLKNLWYLTCAGTEVASVDLSYNKQLASVYLCENVITELDVSMLSDLQQLYCGNQRNNIVLKLKLSEAQKEKWEKEWSKEPCNQNIILVND